MPEVVAQSNLGTCPYTSGGGFSTYYPTPFYQLENVKNYLALVANDTALRPATGYNGAGRGYPDVTMQGYYYVVLTGAQLYLASGTSASCPAMAGVLSTLNAARMRIGKGAVGFVHPALYKHASKFTNDVVGGNNKCTQNGLVCCSQGFHATPGWDPASGLGSINYGKMEAVFLTLGQEVNALAPSSTPTTAYPSVYPTTRPTSSPTFLPSMKPNSNPSFNPTIRPTFSPTAPPTTSMTTFQSLKPTSDPSKFPTQRPVTIAVQTMIPSSVPTSSPSARPSAIPSVSPTAAPTMTPSSVPTSSPSATPSAIPSVSPTAAPTMTPSSVPTSSPSATPSAIPSV